MPDSVREQLLMRMEAVFEAVTVADSGGGTIWGRVLSSPYSGREKSGQNILSIVEGNESYIDVVSPDKRDRSLEVDLQTRVYVPLNTKPRAHANSVLADIEEIVERNCHWNGMAYATFLLANSVEREDTADRNIEISVFLSIRYRTKRTDPRAR